MKTKIAALILTAILTLWIEITANGQSSDNSAHKTTVARSRLIAGVNAYYNETAYAAHAVEYHLDLAMGNFCHNLSSKNDLDLEGD